MKTLHMLSTQSEPDLKSTFLATILKTHEVTLHALIQMNWGYFVSPLGESEGLVKGISYIARQSFRLQEFDDAL